MAAARPPASVATNPLSNVRLSMPHASCRIGAHDCRRSRSPKRLVTECTLAIPRHAGLSSSESLFSSSSCASIAARILRTCVLIECTILTPNGTVNKKVAGRWCTSSAPQTQEGGWYKSHVLITDRARIQRKVRRDEDHTHLAPLAPAPVAHNRLAARHNHTATGRSNRLPLDNRWSILDGPRRAKGRRCTCPAPFACWPSWPA